MNDNTQSAADAATLSRCAVACAGARARAWTVKQGDALALLRDLPSGGHDLLLTDPPYSSGGMVRGDRVQGTKSKYIRGDSKSGQALAEFTGDNRDGRGFAYWSALWLGEARRALAPGAVAMLFSDWRQLPTTTDYLQAGGFVWRGVVPWYKPNSRPQKGRFSAACEYVVWGSNGPMPHDGPCLDGFYKASPPRDREHVTEKPLELMRTLVKVCRPGGRVLDPFLGRGTTGMAAVMEGLSITGFELSEHYAEIAERSIAEAAGDYMSVVDGGLFGGRS